MRRNRCFQIRILEFRVCRNFKINKLSIEFFWGSLDYEEDGYDGWDNEIDEDGDGEEDDEKAKKRKAKKEKKKKKKAEDNGENYDDEFVVCSGQIFLRFYVIDSFFLI